MQSLWRNDRAADKTLNFFIGNYHWKSKEFFFWSCTKTLFTKDYDKRSEHTLKIFGFKFSGEFFTVGLFRYEDKYTASLSRRKGKKKHELALTEKFHAIKLNFVNRQ